MDSSIQNLTRAEAISKCEKAQPGRFIYSMFSYNHCSSPTIFKCKCCGHRFLATPEAIWRNYYRNCPNASCDKS